eukprot:5560585-Pyramimonas_sp.AAC.2
MVRAENGPSARCACAHAANVCGVSPHGDRCANGPSGEWSERPCGECAIPRTQAHRSTDAAANAQSDAVLQRKKDLLKIEEEQINTDKQALLDRFAETERREEGQKRLKQELVEREVRGGKLSPRSRLGRSASSRTV